MSYYDELKAESKKTWNYYGVECMLVEREVDDLLSAMLVSMIDGKDDIFAPFYCGYAIFKDCCTLLPDDTVNSIEVHGGVTLWQVVDDIVIYGFDCNHSGDNSPQLRDMEWLTKEVERMVDQLMQKYGVEGEYDE